MYNPCFECLNRYGRKYSEECVNICVFAQAVHEINIEVQKIGELVENQRRSKNASDYSPA